jgi:hypothetical protein
MVAAEAVSMAHVRFLVPGLMCALTVMRRGRLTRAIMVVPIAHNCEKQTSGTACIRPHGVGAGFGVKLPQQQRTNEQEQTYRFDHTNSPVTDAAVPSIA